MRENVLTEHDAAVKRCCVPGVVPENSVMCVGSRCMAWRWHHEKEPLTDAQIAAARTAVGVARALQPDREPKRGYCGRAGEP